ncbi:MAG: extracellular solute-binding protein [Chloroflexota bacterium]
MSTKLSRRSMLKWMAAGTTAMALSACVAPVPGGEGGGAAPDTEGITIGWARHGSEGDLPTEDGLAELFKAKNSDVTIDPIVLPWNDYNTKIPVMVAGGTAPDTFGCHPALMAETHTAGGSIPLTDFIDAIGPDLNYDDVVYHGDALFEGQVFGLPQKSCTHQLRYNKTIFQDAGLPTPGELYWEQGADGWNWNAFVEMGKELTKDLDSDGETDQYFYGGSGGTNQLGLIRAAGGEVFNDDISLCTINSADAVEGIEWMASLVLEHGIQPPPEMQANELGITFNTGKVVMAGGTTCDSVRDLREDRELPFEWDFVMLPAGSAGFRTWGDTDQIVVSSTSENAQAAFDWAVYRSSLEAWEEGYDAGIVLAFSDGPTRWSIFESKAYTEPLGVLDIEMIKEGYRNTIPNPFVPRSPQPYRVLFTVMTTEVDNSLRGVKTAQEAADDMCTQIEEILAEG